jgi:2-keto-4-pentenoate hydratase/2-oxohepta-3-ene-1,7-dioic acid hydratase in catechol pathway
MKFATAFVSGTSRLYVETMYGMVDVVEAAEALGLEQGEGLRDVGALLRAGDPAIGAVRAIVDREEKFAGLATTLDSLELAPPIVAPASIVCVGRNFAEHAAEGGDEVPPVPILFSKFPNTLVGSGQSVVAHRLTDELDYEGELCAVISRTARRVKSEDAWLYVGGFTVMNDISARDLQLGDVQWIRGKSLDTFAPLGPLFITADEILDVGRLRIETRVNGEIRQNASCGDMIYPIPRLVEFISEGITLQPGDLIATGTPAGTGIGHHPPKYMSAGDVVEVTIAEIGTLRSFIVADEFGVAR